MTLTEFLCWYFGIAALIGTYMWFTAGKFMPTNPKISKESTLFWMMATWPLVVFLYVGMWLTGQGEHRDD